MKVELTDEQYHADTTRVSKSGLDLINISPSAYWWEKLRVKSERELWEEQQKKVEEKPHFVFGKAFHAAILEPDTFDSRFAITPSAKEAKALDTKDDYVTKATELGFLKISSATKLKLKEMLLSKDKNILFYDDFLEGFGVGKIALTKAQYDMCCRMRDKVYDNPGASVLFEKGQAEQSYFWDEPATGAPCKIRLDWFSESTGFIVDAKSMLSAHPIDFGKEAYNYRYHVQAPFYTDGFFNSQGVKAHGFIFLCIEKSRNHEVGIYVVSEDETPEVYSLGQMEYRDNCKTYMQARKSGYWKGYGDEVKPLVLPTWAFTKPKRIS